VIGLIVFALVGFGLFLAFLILGMREFAGENPQLPAVVAVRQMVKLEGLSFTLADRLLDDGDYNFLLSHPNLRLTAKRLRRSRQELALAWLGMLLGDLNELWRLRRFLVRRGIPASAGEELRILRNYVFAVLFLNFARIAIHCAGPFAMRRMTRRCSRLVELMSYAPAQALSRMPQAGWSELRRNWAASAP
jgi:hypothetical protein